ncbi:MAG: dihydropteroate synthase [Elusimicrobia bacterium]|nr:dihydropteroate synthase [Elusimicrobiota bacterium]
MPSSRPAWPKTSAPVEGTVRRVPRVMGIVNATPDSFYPESRAPGVVAAVERALELCREGADFLDIGGQSTRPGSEPVPEAEELGRVIPALKALGGRVSVPISVDTDKAEVARQALKAGAAVLNDVSALRNDRGMAAVACGFDNVILMHRGGGSPKTMQDRPAYDDVVEEVYDFLEERMEFFAAAGGRASQVWVDPGIGFGKSLEHNLALLRNLSKFSRLAPVLLGVSRKSFLGHFAAKPGGPAPGPEARLEGSLAVACWASLQNVSIIRVHDVEATCRALKVWEAISC